MICLRVLNPKIHFDNSWIDVQNNKSYELFDLVRDAASTCIVQILGILIRKLIKYGVKSLKYFLCKELLMQSSSLIPKHLFFNRSAF